ncbi:MAG: NUDIX hydrolase [Gammaproteobacteria bacterium]|nr:NUDIX hydrolase [Gammaproteobacteria bacterium]
MEFCCHCGDRVSLSIPEGDDRQRHVCGGCGAIHYQNPKVVTGCIPEWEDKVLLCRRAIEPRRGYWTLPAGFMENGESSHEGAAREAHEEANARVRITGLYTLFSLPRIDQVYLFFRSRLLDLDFSPGIESLEVSLFSRDEIPWDDLAFQVVYETLRFYYQDRDGDGFRVRSGTIERTGRTSSDYRLQLI